VTGRPSVEFGALPVSSNYNKPFGRPHITWYNSVKKLG